MALDPAFISPTRILVRAALTGAVLTTLAIGAVFPAAAAADRVGVSAAVRGDVAVKTSGAARKAQAGENLFLGDQVTTQKQSGLQILLLDETTFTVGENCDLVIDKFVYNPSSSNGKVAATVTRGAMRYISGLISRDNPDNVTLSTPLATIGVRGTMADIVVGQPAINLAKIQGYSTAGADPANATFVVLRGPGDRRNSLDRRGLASVTGGGGTVTLNAAGLVTFVGSANSAPMAPMAIRNTVERALTAGFRTGVKSAGNKTGGTKDAAAASGQSAQDGSNLADSNTSISEKNRVNQNEIKSAQVPGAPPPPPLQGSGVINNVGLELATREMTGLLPGARTFTQTGNVLYTPRSNVPGGLQRFGSNGSINVFGAEGRQALGSYNVSVTATPTVAGAQIGVLFDQILAPARGFNNDSIAYTGTVTPSTGAASVRFDAASPGATASTNCLTRGCNGAVDIIGNPSTLVSGASHSLLIGQPGSQLSGSGLTTTP